jgi:hypothetical protein
LRKPSTARVNAVVRKLDSHIEAHRLSRRIVTMSRALTPHDVATQDASFIVMTNY